MEMEGIKKEIKGTWKELKEMDMKWKNMKGKELKLREVYTHIQEVFPQSWTNLFVFYPFLIFFKESLCGGSSLCLLPLY